MRWPSEVAAATGPPIRRARRGAAVFDRALAHVLEMEGGYDDDPYDPGGPTNRGITLAVFAAWKGVTVDAGSLAGLKAELQRIPEAAVRDIYTARYWRPASCDGIRAGARLLPLRRRRQSRGRRRDAAVAAGGRRPTPTARSAR